MKSNKEMRLQSLFLMEQAVGIFQGIWRGLLSERKYLEAMEYLFSFMEVFHTLPAFAVNDIFNQMLISPIDSVAELALTFLKQKIGLIKTHEIVELFSNLQIDGISVDIFDDVNCSSRIKKLIFFLFQQSERKSDMQSFLKRLLEPSSVVFPRKLKKICDSLRDFDLEDVNLHLLGLIYETLNNLCSKELMIEVLDDCLMKNKCHYELFIQHCPDSSLKIKLLEKRMMIHSRIPKNETFDANNYLQYLEKRFTGGNCSESKMYDHLWPFLMFSQSTQQHSNSKSLLENLEKDAKHDINLKKCIKNMRLFEVSLLVD